MISGQSIMAARPSTAVVFAPPLARTSSRTMTLRPCTAVDSPDKETPVTSRLRSCLAAAVAADAAFQKRPTTVACPPRFERSAAIMARQMQRAQAKAREQEEEWARRSKFKARPAPTAIYGDLSNVRKIQAERAEERARREEEEYARLSKFIAKPPPFHIYGDVEAHRQQREQAKAVAAMKCEFGCKDPPAAADLPPWRLTDGSILAARDDYSETAEGTPALSPPTPSPPTPPASTSPLKATTRPSTSPLKAALKASSNPKLKPLDLSQRLRDAAASAGAGLHGGGHYGRSSYWEERYARRPIERDGKALFEDWYAPYSAIREVLLPLLKPADRILHVGCGQSRLGEEIYKDGFCNVLNMDISVSCIQQMATRYAKLTPKSHYRVMVSTLHTTSHPTRAVRS